MSSPPRNLRSIDPSINEINQWDQRVNLSLSPQPPDPTSPCPAHTPPCPALTPPTPRLAHPLKSLSLTLSPSRLRNCSIAGLCPSLLNSSSSFVCNGEINQPVIDQQPINIRTGFQCLLSACVCVCVCVCVCDTDRQTDRQTDRHVHTHLEENEWKDTHTDTHARTHLFVSLVDDAELERVRQYVLVVVDDQLRTLRRRERDRQTSSNAFLRRTQRKLTLRDPKGRHEYSTYFLFRKQDARTRSSQGPDAQTQRAGLVGPGQLPPVSNNAAHSSPLHLAPNSPTPPHPALPHPNPPPPCSTLPRPPHPAHPTPTRRCSHLGEEDGLEPIRTDLVAHQLQRENTRI